VVYQITDANCPWCHRFWLAARPWVDSGKVQVRHLFVGVIRADSAAKAAAILEAKDPSAMLAKNERTFDEGGVAPVKTISAASLRALEVNYKLMADLGFRGTPGLVYRGKDGSVQMLGGFPKGEQLLEVLGPR
jgi:thiol:disulfide interchange protein DsbG